LIGTRGVAAVNAYRPRLEVWNDELPWLPPRPAPEDPMGFWRSTLLRLGMAPKQGWILPDGEPPSLGDARYFLDCLEQGVSSEVDAAAGAAALEVLMAAYESASTGQPVRIPPHAPKPRISHGCRPFGCAPGMFMLPRV